MWGILKPYKDYFDYIPSLCGLKHIVAVQMQNHLQLNYLKILTTLQEIGTHAAERKKNTFSYFAFASSYFPSLNNLLPCNNYSMRDSHSQMKLVYNSYLSWLNTEFNWNYGNDSILELWNAYKKCTTKEKIKDPNIGK